MKIEKSDRRVKYTKELLRGALIELLMEKHISSITVRELCDLADVNRSTFYAHYANPLDLLRHVELEVLSNLKLYLEKQDPSKNQPISEGILTMILEYLRENKRMATALLSQNSDLALHRDIMELTQAVSFKTDPQYGERERNYLASYSVAGCINIIQLWLHDGMRESPAEISKLILRIFYYGVSYFLE